MEYEDVGESPEFTIFDEPPTEDEVIFFAKKLGIHPFKDKKYLYLAREGKFV